MAGTDIVVLDEHEAPLEETLSHKIKCIPNYRNRVMQLIRFLKEYYPAYAEVVVFELSQEQRQNKKTYHTSTHDLKYNILNPKYQQLFMSATKKKPDGKVYSYDHIRKFHDAVLYCAKLANMPLPAGYMQSMKNYLDTMKKEKTNAKTKGQMDEQEADIIPMKLARKMCEWAVLSGNIFVWAFTIIQWNIMGRTVNVAPLGFHNLSCKEAADSIVIQYDKNKTDQKGESTSPKNCYANPFDPYICMFLSLGCYLCINDANSEELGGLGQHRMHIARP